MSGKREKKVRKLERRVEVLERRVAVCETWRPGLPEVVGEYAQRRGFWTRLAAWFGKEN